jgi:gamma-glutamyltranspeptidase/glutathione hydrolase
MKYLLYSFMFFISFSVCCQPSNKIVGPGREVNPYQYAIIKNAIYTKASVACAHPLAAQVGAIIMRQGGNAFDASVAVQFALAVVYPNAGNIGGGGFMLARKKDGLLIALDFREEAPAFADRNMYLDSTGQPNNILSERGHLSVGIPGSVAGILETARFGNFTLARLIQPAIDLAEKGFTLTAREAASLNEEREEFIRFNTSPTAFVKEALWKEGDTLFQPELAATLVRIRDMGKKGFYEGETAKLIVQEMKRGNGIITENDLKKYESKRRIPLESYYRNHKIIGFPPPSSGGILLTQMLKMIEPYPMKIYGFQSRESVQLMVEAERRAYADRAMHIGDPDFWKVPVNQLTDSLYLMSRMSDYNALNASPSSVIHAGNIPYESEETTHISIADEEGNVVTITTTLNDSYGSHTVVGGAGFILNDEMDDFSIKPGVPNMYGAVGGEANAITPGKRMLSSMTPTIILKNDKPFMVVGTPGGTTIPTSVFQTIVNVIDFNMSAADAISRPKFHHQWLPDLIFTEKEFDKNLVNQLSKMGYIFKERGGIGRVECILFNKGKKETAADPRGDDAVAGY